MGPRRLQTLSHEALYTINFLLKSRERIINHGYNFWHIKWNRIKWIGYLKVFKLYRPVLKDTDKKKKKGHWYYSRHWKTSTTLFRDGQGGWWKNEGQPKGRKRVKWMKRLGKYIQGAKHRFNQGQRDLKDFGPNIRGHHKIGPVGFQNHRELVASQCLPLFALLSGSIYAVIPSLFRYHMLVLGRELRTSVWFPMFLAQEDSLLDLGKITENFIKILRLTVMQLKYNHFKPH